MFEHVKREFLAYSKIKKSHIYFYRMADTLCH